MEVPDATLCLLVAMHSPELVHRPPFPILETIPERKMDPHQ